MEIEGDFSKDLLEEFLTKISPNELKNVDEIYLVFNPKEPDMPRHLRLVSSAPIPSWDPAWKSLKCEDSIPQKLLDENIEQEKVVLDYYNQHKEQLKDVTSLGSQEKIQNATGVHGGSFLLHTSRTNQKWTIKYNLAFIFLHLARAMNSGGFDVDAPFELSLKMFPKIWNCRVKLHMPTRQYMTPVLHNIQQVIKQQNACTYALKFKTDVACYLNKLREINEARKFFEASINTTTDCEISEIAELLGDVKL